jgi:hypothetical protein
MDSTQKNRGFFGFVKEAYNTGKKAYQAVRPYVKAVAAFILELEGEKYKIAMNDVGPETEKLLKFIEKYRLDKLHEIIRDANWTLTAPYSSFPYLDLKIVTGEQIDPSLVQEIIERLQEYGQAAYNTEFYGEDYIEEFYVNGNRQILEDVYEGLILLDQAYHKGQFHYVYSSAWE